MGLSDQTTPVQKYAKTTNEKQKQNNKCDTIAKKQAVDTPHSAHKWGTNYHHFTAHLLPRQDLF